MIRQNNIKLNLAVDFQESLNYIQIKWVERERGMRKNAKTLTTRKKYSLSFVGFS